MTTLNQDLTGPWSSNGEYVEKAGFKPTIDVGITDDPHIFEESGGNYAGNIILELAREIMTELDGVEIGTSRFGRYIPVKKGER